MNTYYKLILLIIGTSLSFFLLSLMLYFYINQQEERFFEESEKQFDSEIKNLLALKAAPLLLTLKDNTNWDEFVKFFKTKNNSWFTETLGVGISVYDVDYMGVYDVNKNFIINTSTSKIHAKDIIPKDKILDLDKTRISKFYLRIPEGIIVVYGATIHPTFDTTKKITKPSGYFFMVRLIDADFLKNLEKITSSTITLLNDKDSFKKIPSKITSSIVLTDSKNKNVATLVFQRDYPKHLNSSKNILLVIFIAFFINLIIYLIYVRKWIHNPLVLITKVLKTGSKKAIKELKNIKGEYVYIGDLFEENRAKRIELEIAKTKAEENNKLKSVFLANLSHEIRTPMNAIVGFSDLVNDANVDSRDKKEYLEIIKNSGICLVSIIEDLIEMSKIDANQTPLKYSSVDLDKVVYELYSTLKITIPNEKNIDFQLIKSLNSVSKDVLTDEIKLKQILTNLISNAIKYTNSGFVSFGYTIDENKELITFSVNDSGIGIRNADLSLIFDRFQRIESDFAINLSGLGLGLSICKAYVVMLGGSITVKSKIEVGSTFIFSIPLRYDDTKQDKKLNTKVNLRENVTEKTILIAEDNNINYLLLKKIIELKNYKVLRAENGQEAVDICRNNATIDLVFMDIKMPVLDGFGALLEIKSFLPNLPILAQTAHSSPEEIEKLIQSGFDDYIIKPLDKGKIYELMESIFSK